MCFLDYIPTFPFETSGEAGKSGPSAQPGQTDDSQGGLRRNCLSPLPKNFKTRALKISSYANLDVFLSKKVDAMGGNISC